MLRTESEFAPLTDRVKWLRRAGGKTTNPHVLVTWVRNIRGEGNALGNRAAEALPAERPARRPHVVTNVAGVLGMPIVANAILVTRLEHGRLASTRPVDM